MEFVLPHMNKFGAGCIQELAPVIGDLGMKKPLIITDANLSKIGVAGMVDDVLKNAGIEFLCFNGVMPNPTKENVYAALKEYRDSGCDCIIGVGGGSPNDCAKAVGLLASNGGVLEDYVGFNKTPKAAPPIILVNTTAGTASEISRALLITDTGKRKKLIIKDIHCLASCSFNDPELMAGLPPHITAATGMDALTHAVESYVCNNHSVMTREIAAGAIRLVFDNLEGSVAEPSNLTYRENMIYAQFMAGMAFCNSGVGLSHAISHPLGAIYNLPHGLCNAILLPAVMEFNLCSSKKDYAALARTVMPELCAGRNDHICSKLLIMKIKKISQTIGTSIPLSELGVKEEDFAMLARESLEDANIVRNPAMPTAGDIIEILRSLY